MMGLGWGDVQTAALWVAAVAGGLAVLIGVVRKTSKGYRHVARTAGAFIDAVLGREEIRHPDTGAVIVPAVPGLGARMATIEDAVAKIADTHQRVDVLEGRVAALEQKDLERALARTESIELMRTIDTAIKADPAPEVEK